MVCAWFIQRRTTFFYGVYIYAVEQKTFQKF